MGLCLCRTTRGDLTQVSCPHPHVTPSLYRVVLCWCWWWWWGYFKPLHLSLPLYHFSLPLLVKLLFGVVDLAGEVFHPTSPLTPHRGWWWVVGGEGWVVIPKETFRLCDGEGSCGRWSGLPVLGHIGSDGDRLDHISSFIGWVKIIRTIYSSVDNFDFMKNTIISTSMISFSPSLVGRRRVLNIRSFSPVSVGSAYFLFIVPCCPVTIFLQFKQRFFLHLLSYASVIHIHLSNYSPLRYYHAFPLSA